MEELQSRAGAPGSQRSVHQAAADPPLQLQNPKPQRSTGGVQPAAVLHLPETPVGLNVRLLQISCRTREETSATVLHPFSGLSGPPCCRYSSAKWARASAAGLDEPPAALSVQLWRKCRRSGRSSGADKSRARERRCSQAKDQDPAETSTWFTPSVTTVHECVLCGCTRPLCLLGPAQVQPDGLQFVLLVLQRSLKAERRTWFCCCPPVQVRPQQGEELRVRPASPRRTCCYQSVTVLTSLMVPVPGEASSKHLHTDVLLQAASEPGHRGGGERRQIRTV